MKLYGITVLSAFLLAGISVSAVPVLAQTVLTDREAAKVLRFERLNATQTRVSGVITNTSPHRVKDVELLVQYHWLWNNERHPGQDSPGRVFTVKLDKELAPGETAPFSYTPPQLPNRTDGTFMPEVDIASFTVLIPQQRSAQR
ncbi:MAG TPA: hypothetical protein VIB79_31400 [Candidatus Binatia bacterium]